MKKTKCFLVLFAFLLIAGAVYSRAGGGGGHSHSHSSSHSSSHHSSSHYSSGSGGGGEISGTTAAIIVGFMLLVFIFVVVVIWRATKKTKELFSAIEGQTRKQEDSKPVIDDSFMAANPGFEKLFFKTKVKTAFLQIQEAWQEQNLLKVRKWISDGVYQRFNLQFSMMKQLGQKNYLSNISVAQIHFIKAWVESSYSVITVAIYFRMDDKFISEKMPELNESVTDEVAMEYWTFVKKSGPADKDLYHSDSCPNCGNMLNTDGGEVSKCPSCATVTYLGDYDWVLSEITQEDSYGADAAVNPHSQVLTELRREEELCIQNMEDKASNAFVHYLFASALNDTKQFRRFATDEVIAELEKEHDEPFIYNRVYLDRVTCSDYKFIEDTHRLSFNIQYNAQRVKLKENKVKLIDHRMETKIAGITLSRKAGKAMSKSKLWSHECPACGAPYNDSTASSCSYCNEKINSTAHDWTVTAAFK